MARLPLGGERGTVNIKCFAQELIPLTLPMQVSNPEPSEGVQHTNYYATTPPLQSNKFYQILT